MFVTWQIVLIVVIVGYTFVGCQLLVEDMQNATLVVEFSKILCRAKIKVIFVYFENQTSLEGTSQILQEVTKCDISYISLRNKFRTAPIEAIKDDGILMYMVMLLNDITQPLALSLIRKKSAAKHLSHIFLLLRNSEPVTKAWLRSSFKQFWRIWLLNIVIIYWREEHLQIYRYNPFRNDYLIRVSYANQLPTLAQLFPKNIPNMQRKPLRMCIYPDVVRAIYTPQGKLLGADGFMSSYIADSLNATRIITHVQANGQQNVSADICLDEIGKEFDDVAMNIRFLSPDSFERRVESTVAHGRDDLCVIVPKAKSAPTFWNVFRSLRMRVWILILLTILLGYGYSSFAWRDTRAVMWMQLLACTLSLPLSHTPRRLSLRLFVIIMLLFGMLICTAFRGNLTSMLISQQNLPDIDDIRALANSPYRILARQRHIKYIERYLNMGHANEAKVRKLMLAVPENVLTNYLDNNDMTYSYLVKYHIGSFEVSSRQHMQYGRPIFHLMNSCLVPFHAVYTVPYGSPYLGFLNKLIRSSHEFGFQRYWDSIMNSKFIKSGAKVVHRGNNNHDDPVVLKIQHLYSVFFLWSMGLMLASLVFICEMVTKNRALTKRRR